MSVAKSRRSAADISRLPAQEISTEVLIEKYAKDGERSIREVRARVAKALAGNESEDRRAFWEAKFLEAQENGFIPAGRHEARWDGLAEDGARAAAGVYFLRLTTPAGSASRRIVLAR